MKRQDLEIAKPCHEDWNGMEDRGERRFCGSCVKEVHDLSWLSAEEASELLSGPRGRVCIRYVVDAETDEVLFRDPSSSKWRMYRQREGVKALMAAAMVAAPMLLAGCEVEPAPEEATASVISPIEIGETAPRLTPAASRKPTFQAKPLPKPVAHIEPLMGEPPMVQEPVVHTKKGEVKDPGASRKPTFQVKKKVKAKKKEKTVETPKPTLIRMGDIAVHEPEEKTAPAKASRKKRFPNYNDIVGEW